MPRIRNSTEDYPVRGPHRLESKIRFLRSILTLGLFFQRADIEGEFKACLEQLVPLLLSPQNLVQKEIGGQKVKVKELVQYFKCYMNLFSGDDLPEPKSMLVVSKFGQFLLNLVSIHWRMFIYRIYPINSGYRRS